MKLAALEKEPYLVLRIFVLLYSLPYIPLLEPGPRIRDRAVVIGAETSYVAASSSAQISGSFRFQDECCWCGTGRCASSATPCSEGLAT